MNLTPEDCKYMISTSVEFDKKFKSRWQLITANYYRIAVYGGWLVSSAPNVDKATFINDPAHEWETIE